MKEILQKWLFECVGVTFTMEDLGKNFKDGVILSRLLEQHGIVHKKAIKHIVSSDNAKVCKNNLRDLCTWFSLLDIKYDDDMISKIAVGRTTTCLILLYELFLALNDKESLKFIHSENLKPPENTLLRKFVCNRFHKKQSHSSSQHIDEYVCEETGYTLTNTDKSSQRISLEGNEKTILCKGMTHHERIRLEDIQYVRNELKNVMTPLKRKTLSQNYQHLLEDMQTINEALESSTMAEERFVHKHVSSSLNKEIKSVDNSEEDQLKTQLVENILKQSEYEKMLAISNFEIGLQKQMRVDSFLKFKSNINNESTNYMNFFSTCKSSEEEITYQVEAINKMELHRKLFDDKIRKRNQRRITTCKQIIKDTIELAIKISESVVNSVTKEQIIQWNKQLNLGESILNKSISTSGSDIPVIEIDEKHEDSEVLNDLLFDNYNHLIGDWFAQTGPDVAYDDLRILAHIVYRLQGAKRPSVKPLQPANIPKYKITSVLNGEFDELTLIKLKSLLVKPKILITDIGSAISYCVDRYKFETDIKPPELPSKSNIKLERAKGSGKPSRGIKLGKNTKELELITSKDEEVQTSLSLFENIDKPKELSSAAEVGMRIHNLETHSDIPVEYMIDVLIEFLKSQSDIEGWVLINFPSTLTEAYHFEKMLSGKMFPNVFNIEEAYNDEEELTQSDEVVKHSKLVYLPVKIPDEFSSYFTSFINIIQDDVKNESSTNSVVDSSNMEEENESEDIILNLTNVYRKKGILKEFIYNELDFGTLKNLARLVLQYDDDNMNIKSSEIFGEEVIRYYDVISTATSVTGISTSKKPPKRTSKSKDVLNTAKEFLQQLITLNKLAMATTESVSQCEEKTIESAEESVLEIDLYPGQDGWSYAKFTIPNDENIYLTGLWEELEINYINSVKIVLKTLKNIENTITPYQNYLIKMMNNAYNNQRGVEETVKHFIENFNKICIKTEVKELTNKVLNFERRLWEISEEKKDELDKKRRELIEQGWVSDTIIDIARNYMSLMEVESNRCNATLMFLHNYYSSMCGVYSRNDMPTICLEPTNLSNYCCEVCKMKCAIVKRLTDETEIHILNPVSEVFENVISYYTTEIGQLKLKYDTVIAINQEHITYTRSEYQERRKHESDKAFYLKELRDGSVDEEDEEASIFNARNTELVNMFHEWNTAVKSELDRFIWRIKLIKGKVIETLSSFENEMANIFHKFHENIVQEFLKENECIDNLCSLLQSAIKTHLPVTSKIITQGNCVYIEDGESLEHTSDKNLPSFDSNIEHQLQPYCLTVEQLEIIVRQFKSIAPDGIIDKYALYFMVEDMIVHANPIDGTSLFPSGWNNVNVIEMRQIFRVAFGNTEKLYWKDFIIYCLDIPCPDIQDIVELKVRFVSFDKENKHTISLDNYSSITLWFQEGINHVDKTNYNDLVKQFLFFLFKTDENEFDYIDFLLAFSKGECSAIGFSKALASLHGRCVIHSNQNEYMEQILKEYDDMVSKMSKEILDELVINIWNERYSVKIEEVFDERKESAKKSQEVRLTSNSIQRASTKSLTSQNIKTKMTNSNDEDVISIKHQQSQTVSLTEIINDINILKSKLYQWTTHVPTAMIYDILENKVVKVFNQQHNIMLAAKDTVAKLDENGLVHIPTLMEESSFHIIFYHTHMFQTFSFLNAVKDNVKCPSMNHTYETM